MKKSARTFKIFHSCVHSIFPSRTSDLSRRYNYTGILKCVLKNVKIDWGLHHAQLRRLHTPHS